MLLIAGCGTTTVYHSKHGRVGPDNKYWKASINSCNAKVRKAKKYRTKAQYDDDVILCLIEKGWRP